MYWERVSWRWGGTVIRGAARDRPGQ